MKNKELTPQDIIADLKSQDIDKRVAALYKVMVIEEITVDLFLEVANLIKDTSAYNPNPNQLAPPRAAVFAPAVGTIAVAVLGKLGEKSYAVIRDTIAKISGLQGDRRISALDGISAVGPTALQNALNVADISKEDAVNILEEILNSRADYPRICSIAIRVLGNLGPLAKKTVSSIARFLPVTDEGYGAEAKLGGYCMVGASDMICSPASEAASALAKIGPESLPSLVRAIDDPDAALSAIEALEKLGNISVSAILKGLGSQCKRTRFRAVDALLSIGEKSNEVLNALTKAIENEKDWFSRRRLKKALKRLGG